MPSNAEIERQQRLLEGRTGLADQVLRRMGGESAFWQDRMSQWEGMRDERLNPLLENIMSGVSDYSGMMKDYWSRAGQEVTAPSLAETEGLSPQAMAALRAQAIEGTAGAYDDALSRAVVNLSRRGMLTGATAAGGDAARLFGGVYAQKAQAKADALRKTTLADEQARRENWVQNRQWNLNRRGLLLEGLRGGLQGQLGGIGTGSALYNVIAGAYDPTKYTGAYNVATQGQLGALSQGTQSIAARPMKQSWWEKYAMPVIGAVSGAGMNALTGGLGGSMPDLSVFAPDVPATTKGLVPMPDLPKFQPKFG